MFVAAWSFLVVPGRTTWILLLAVFALHSSEVTNFPGYGGTIPKAFYQLRKPWTKFHELLTLPSLNNLSFKLFYDSTYTYVLITYVLMYVDDGTLQRLNMK